MKHLVIIGGGPGGYAAAFAAAKKGLKVTLIEQEGIGGTCLNWGCIPTKTLKATAEKLEFLHQAAQFGITLKEAPSLDWPVVSARLNKVKETLRGGLAKTCAALGIELVSGRGKLLPGLNVAAVLADGAQKEFKADAVILATGSRPAGLPGLAIDGERILSSDHALRLDKLPQKLIIVGGGVIGCEFACIFRTFGVEVHIVEGMDRLLPLPGVDAAMSRLLFREMKKMKIAMYLGATVSKVTPKPGGGIIAELGPSPFIEGEPPAPLPETLGGDCLLLTVGRAPNADGLGLAEAGVNQDNRGWITADEYMRTSAPGIYAIGDVLGPKHIMLAHVASFEGEVAVRNILGEETAMTYDVVPSAIFTMPEVGSVGLSEEEAAQKGFSIRSASLLVRELGKAQAAGEIAGEFKLIADAATDKILGAHMIGPHATELIAELGLALSTGATVSDIARTIHAHPTLAEGWHELALGMEANK